MYMELTENDAHKAAAPNLQHLDAFNAVLKGYHVSAPARRTLDQTRFVLLVGPSSSGRNTIINQLLKTGKYHFIVSDTTRPPRMNDGVREEDGVQYWFRAETDMLADLKEGKFLEAEVIHAQQVSGISIRELEKAHQNHKIAITDIDIGGVLNVVQAKPDTAVILIVPPDYDEWKRRLRARSKMSDAEYQRRIETAFRILSEPAVPGFNIVVNDNLADAVQRVDAIAHGHTDAALQAHGAALVQQLRSRLQAELKPGT